MSQTEQPHTITIETSPRNAFTDPSTGMRFYRLQGRDLPSVTTLRRMAGLPHGLACRTRFTSGRSAGSSSARSERRTR